MIERIGFENLPNVYFSKIKIIEKPNSMVRVVVYLKVFDDKENPHWSYSELFKKRLNIRLRFFQSGGKELLKKHLRNIKPNVNKVFSAEFDLLKIKGLSVSANLEMDLSDLGTDISWVSDNQWYRGPESRELIYDILNRQINSMFRFLKGDSVYYGPVHKHQGPIMEGSFHSNRQHQVLEGEEFDNIKSSYFNTKINLSKGSEFPFSTPLPVVELLSNVELDYVQSIFCLSKTNMSFYTDHGRTLAFRNLEYFKNFKDKIDIKQISAYPSGEQELEVALLKGQEKATQGQCELQNLNLIMNNDVMFFEFKDKNNRSTIGVNKKIQYVVRFSSKIEEKIVSLIYQALECLDQLNLAIDIMSRNYSKHEETFDEKGLFLINEMYSIDFKEKKAINMDDALEAYWIKIPNLYSELTAFITNNSENNVLKVYSFLNPLTATIDSMRTVSEIIEKTINSLNRIYNLDFKNYSSSKSSNYQEKITQRFFTGNLINYIKPSKVYSYDDLDDLVVNLSDYKIDSIAENFPTSLSFLSSIVDGLDYSYKCVKSVKLTDETEVVFNQDNVEEAISQTSLETLDDVDEDLLPIFSSALSLRIFNNPPQADSLGNVKEYVGDNSLFAIPDSTDLLTFVSTLKEEDKKVITNTILSNKWSGQALASLSKPPFLNDLELPSSINSFYDNQESIQNEEQTSDVSANDYLANSFFNSVEVKYFDGFQFDKNGFFDLNNPNFKTMTKQTIDNLPSNSSLIVYKQFVDILNQIIAYYYGSSGVLTINDENIKSKINIIRKQ